MDGRWLQPPVYDLDEVINDAGMHERGMLHWVDHPEVGRVCLPSSPLRFADAPAPTLKPSPLLNQHEEEVLGGDFWVYGGTTRGAAGGGGDQYGGAGEGVAGRKLIATKNGCNSPPKCA
jgi:hypothetical protein